MIKTPLPRDFIYEFQGDINLVTEYLQGCLAANEIKFVPTTDNPNSTESGYPLLKNDILFNWITEKFNQVGNIYFNLNEDSKLVICDAWLTRTNFLNKSRFHNHPLSIFSGLLYLHDNDTETIFTVEDEFLKRHYDLLSPILKKNNGNSIRVKPKIGKLIIWPSYLYHNIALNKNKELRYTLALNSFLDGEISNEPTKKLNMNVRINFNMRNL